MRLKASDVNLGISGKQAEFAKIFILGIRLFKTQCVYLLFFQKENFKSDERLRDFLSLLKLILHCLTYDASYGLMFYLYNEPIILLGV